MQRNDDQTDFIAIEFMLTLFCSFAIGSQPIYLRFYFCLKYTSIGTPVNPNSFLSWFSVNLLYGSFTY